MTVLATSRHQNFHINSFYEVKMLRYRCLIFFSTGNWKKCNPNVYNDFLRFTTLRKSIQLPFEKNLAGAEIPARYLPNQILTSLQPSFFIRFCHFHSYTWVGPFKRPELYRTTSQRLPANCVKHSPDFPRAYMP